MTVLIAAAAASDPLTRATIDGLVRREHDVRLFSPDADEAAMEWLAHVEPWVDAGCDLPLGLLEGCRAVLLLRTSVADGPAARGARALQRVRRLVATASGAGVDRVVYVAGTRARHAEAAALPDEEALVRQAAAWLILRAPSLYGPGDPVIARHLTAVRNLPAVPVIGGGCAIRPIWFEDLAAAAAGSVEGPPEELRRVVTLAGPDTVTSGDLYRRLTALTGRRPLRLPLPALAAFGAGFLPRRARRPASMARAIAAFAGRRTLPSDDAVAALARLARVAPMRLSDGLARLAIDEDEQLPEEGVGGLEVKHFWADIRAPRLDARELMRRFRTRLTEVMPIAFGVEPGSPQTLVVRGATLTARLPLRGHAQVRVEEASDRRVTFATLQGHPLAGVVRFESSPIEGGVRFSVTTCDRASNAFDWLTLALGGGGGQDANWRVVVSNMVEQSGGQAPDGVRSDVRTVTGAPAARLNTQIRRLAQARRADACRAAARW
jgi:NADH dehydrogenase